MKEEDKLNTINRYNKRLSEYGYAEETLGWSRGKNEIRFDALLKEWIDEIENSSIADFGCGFGDFYTYILKAKNIKNFKYKGIDINEKLVQIGKNNFPQADFWVGDIVNDNFNQTFDFVFSSGVFNHKLIGNNEYDFIEETLNKISQISTKGFAINFLSDKVDYVLEHTFHSNPGKIIELCYKYSNNVILRNDYMPFEFTVYVRMDKIIDSQKIVFNK